MVYRVIYVYIFYICGILYDMCILQMLCMYMCIRRKCGRLLNRGLALNLLCNTGWPQIHSPPFSSSQVFELQVCVTICGFEIS